MDREAFFNRKPKTTQVTLDDGSEWHVRKMSQSEAETLNRRYLKGNDEAKACEGMRYVVSRCVVDDEGKRLFTDADAEKLADIDFDAINTIADVVLTFSGLKAPKA